MSGEMEMGGKSYKTNTETYIGPGGSRQLRLKFDYFQLQGSDPHLCGGQPGLRRLSGCSLLLSTHLQDGYSDGLSGLRIQCPTFRFSASCIHLRMSNPVASVCSSSFVSSASVSPARFSNSMMRLLASSSSWSCSSPRFLSSSISPSSSFFTIFQLASCVRSWVVST